ncbi:MAG: HU family DNA-binding protein [Planctomycetia bacterium]|nr:HU family DNA-binding protein [Planctomycetia bacterium]
MAKATTTKKPMTKSEIQSAIAESTGLSKKQVADVLEGLTAVIKKSVGPKSAGAFVFPGLFKIEKKVVPAKKARKNVPDPFNPGQTRDYPAKPASSKIKIRPLKGLKDAL